MSPNAHQPEENFDEAANKFDLDRLRKALEAENPDKIRTVAWKYFKGVLSLGDVKKVAEKCSVDEGTVYTELNREIKGDLLKVLNLPEKKRVIWSQVPGWFIEAGYGLPEQSQTPCLAPPKPTYNLVGRDNLFYDLKQRLFTRKSLAFNGLPGVGKTALAIELANDAEVLEQFPDGVLWAGLGRQPDILALLSTWATALEIPPAKIARLTSIEAWAIAIHIAIGKRRMLLVIDDAWQAEAALTFKLGGSNCAHLVTTRLPETALEFAAENAIAIEELNENTGLLLLAQFVPGVVEAELDEAKALVRAVGGLPLALILMGKYLRKESHSRQPRRLHRALERLRNTEERLRLAQPQSPLEHQPSLPIDIPLSLLAVIEISDEALDEASSQALYSLSIFPAKPNTFSEDAALAICNTSVDILDKLYDSGLLESSQQGRYTFHQTISDYASLKFIDETVFIQMADFFINYVKINQTNYHLLDIEKNNIIAAFKIAFARGMHELVEGIYVFCRFLQNRGLYALAKFQLKQAEEIAKLLPDTSIYLAILDALGKIESQMGNYEEAKKYYKKILSKARDLKNFGVIFTALSGLAAIAIAQGDYNQARIYSLEGLKKVDKIENQVSNNTVKIELEKHKYIKALLEYRQEFTEYMAAAALNNGNYEEAENYFHKNINLSKQLGRFTSVFSSLEGLGVIANRCGKNIQSKKYLQEALTLADNIQNVEITIRIQMNLGAVALTCEDYSEANYHTQKSLELAQKAGHRLLISQLLYQRGEIHLRQQEINSASKAFDKSLVVAREGGIQHSIAMALYGLAQVRVAKGDIIDALNQAKQSLAILESLGDCRANLVKQWLYIQDSDSYYLLGEAYLEQQKLDLAFKAFFKSLVIAKQGNIEELTARGFYMLSRVAAAQGNFIDALDWGHNSLTIIEAIDHDRATEIQQWLDELVLMQS